MESSDEGASAGVPTGGLRIEIRGTVQGVGMRPFVYRVAKESGISGHVRNEPTGVVIEAYGSPDALETFVARLRAERPPAAVFDYFHELTLPPELFQGFKIVESSSSGERRVSIPPDLATCEACLAEVWDEGNRRYRYPFTNCTNCGPRFTIARDVPYDRQATTMAAFRMCPECRGEYVTPSDRRFHAEPNACPACGPRLSLLGGAGRAPMGVNQIAIGPSERKAVGLEWRGRDEIEVAAEALRAGRILAVKGIGGFHLACDAESSEAVLTLRERKRRDEKPFAVMVADIAAAERLASLRDAERELLLSVERPIVLVQKRPGSSLAPEVAPAIPLLGLFLPYSPLHHLLLAAVGRPLVMTSGNLSDEPIAFRDDDALLRLGDVADLVLTHDREIETRTDDSVARVIAGRATVMRRSRGFVPRPIRITLPFEETTLACGALLKNTFCIGRGDEAVLGPHIGDLENLETFTSFEEAIGHLERFLEVTPRIIAHDLHPEILSTRYALDRARSLGVRAVGVQHHHAHVAAAMAEHHLDGPVIGLAFDGTGYGSDGAAWGGEVLFVWYDRFERIATLRPFPLAGGDRAVKEPWRVALALVDDAFEGHPPLDAVPLFRRVSPSDIAVVRRMIAEGVNAPKAHGMGRVFDAVGAILLDRGWAGHEAQVAMALEGVAGASGAEHYPFQIDEKLVPWQLDLRPMIRALVADLLAGIPASISSARFHRTLIVAAAELVRRATCQRGSVPVVLTGGCFQNAILAEGILAELAGPFTLYLHGEVPPGDGGIALGQAAVANAVVRLTR